MVKIKDATDRQDYFTTDAYVSGFNNTSYPGRCGKVKRTPTLSELEGDDVDYYLADDVYYEDRR